MEGLVGVVERHPRAIVAAALLVTIAAAWRATKLRLATDFAELDDPGQQALVKQLEPTPLFQGIWMLTVMGTFAAPSYGGDRDGAGEKVLGIARAPSYRPPFGYYDAHAEPGE